MPKYKNSFRGAEFVEETIVDDKGAVIGTVRLKPSSVLWKSKGKHTFLAVPLETFVDWIESEETGAKTTNS